MGPLLHHTLNNSAERTARKKAMRKTFYSMGDFWRSKAPFTYKKAIFISKIAETGISGRTSCCLQNIDYETIQKGKFYDTKDKFWEKQPGNRLELNKKQNIDQSAMQKFYENLGCARFLQNFGCDELSGFKKMVKYAHCHVFEITALFGVSACDEQEPCDEEGRLRPTANPWAHRIAGDIQALSYSDDAVEFKKIYK